MGSTLNTIFIVCLALTIVFFLITVVLFFLFDIKTIFSIRTGKAAAKTVKEMEAANANTGRLRVGKVTNTGALNKNDKKSGKSGKLKTKTQTFGLPPTPSAPPTPPQPQSPVTVEMPSQPVTPENLSGGYYPSQPDANQTEVLTAPETEVLTAPGTEVLRPASADTQLLDNTDSYAQTGVLSEPQAGAPSVIKTQEMAPQPQVQAPARVRFDIVKIIILSDTDEIIE